MNSLLQLRQVIWLKFAVRHNLEILRFNYSVYFKLLNNVNINMFNRHNSYYVKYLLYFYIVKLMFNSLIVKVMKYTRKIKTFFGYAPVSLNFDCLMIYATSCWILQQISKRELEHRHHVVIRTPSLLCSIRVMVYEFSYLTEAKDGK